MENENRFTEALEHGGGREIRINYSNDEITVVWKPQLCIHATNCFRELPTVFKPLRRKWVDVNGASSERIQEQVMRCPSGAL